MRHAEPRQRPPRHELSEKVDNLSSDRAGSPDPSDVASDTSRTLMRRVFARRNLALISVVFGIALWELATYLRADSVLLVSTVEIFRAAIEMWNDGELWRHVSSSGKSLLLGYAAATVTGIAVGIALGLSKTMRAIFEPWMYAFYCIPIVALAPVFIIAFGISMTGHVAIVLTLAFFPIAVNTIAGLGMAEEQYIDVARAYGGSRADIVRHIMLPSAVPFIITGMRLSVTRALIGVVVAELFGARAGVGHMILMAQQRYATEVMYVGVLILAAVGILGTSLLGRVEARFTQWRPASETD